ncbi:TetR/AcrR family transcriptional regulator, partial [Clostridium sp.]|uniref:TetR/AcrR family transcriptional regulator n=1 Tax=Clostridium sp. TaxID=1506 RepID=UPI0034644C93
EVDYYCNEFKGDIMEKIDIKKRRMMKYFIEAAREIIDNEGIEKVTIRKVASRAGYNSSTLYNYFDNLEHLTFFAVFHYFQDYTNDIGNKLKYSRNSMERFFIIWESFCLYSFKYPKIYKTMFFGEFNRSIDESIKAYYKIFQHETDDLNEETKEMIESGDIYVRNSLLLESCAREEFIDKSHINELNEIILLTYEAMITRYINNKICGTPEEMTKKFMLYLKRIMK